MSRFSLYCLICIALGGARLAQAENATTSLRVLLLGDSTVLGSGPRDAAPGADPLETIIRKLLAADTSLPPVEVFNKGRNGDTVRGLLASRYAKDVAGLPGEKVDFVFVRYGINDYTRCKPFATEFPKAYHELIARLRKDHPQALITPETIFPYNDDKIDQRINDCIREVAAAEKLPLLDTYSRCIEETQIQGPHALTLRYLSSLDPISEKLRALIPKHSIIYGNNICVLDNSLDVHFRDVPGWFSDHHPNLAGYHVIADEIATYLAPLIRKHCVKEQ